MRQKAPKELFVNWYSPTDFSTFLTEQDSLRTMRRRKDFPEKIRYVRTDLIPKVKRQLVGYMVKFGGASYLSPNRVWVGIAHGRVFGLDEHSLASYEAGRLKARVVRIVKRS